MKQRTEQYWKWRTYTALLVAFGLVIWAVGCNGNTAYGQKQVTDTIPKKTNYTIKIESTYLQSNLDSLNYIVSFCGKTLSVDQADNLKGMYYRVIGNILKNISVDTLPKSGKK